MSNIHTGSTSFSVLPAVLRPGDADPGGPTPCSSLRTIFSTLSARAAMSPSQSTFHNPGSRARAQPSRSNDSKVPSAMIRRSGNPGPCLSINHVPEGRNFPGCNGRCRAEPGSSQGVSGSPLRRELRETMKRPCAQSCQGLQKVPDYGFISQLPCSGCARHH